MQSGVKQQNVYTLIHHIRAYFVCLFAKYTKIFVVYFISFIDSCTYLGTVWEQDEIYWAFEGGQQVDRQLYIEGIVYFAK
jgi:hypothetical protein